MAREGVLAQLDYWRLEVGARVAALATILTVSTLTGSLDDLIWPFVLLTLLAIAALLPVQSRWLRRWRPPVEALVSGLIIGLAPSYDSALLPYVVTPSLSAGLIGGWGFAVISTGATLVSLLSATALRDSQLAMDSTYWVDALQWSLLALTMGLLAAWVRRIQTVVPNDDESYLEASRLLAQLRDVSRELSAGLDVVSIGAHLLDDIQEKSDATRGWVFAYRGSGNPTPVAYAGAVDSDLLPDFEAVGRWQEPIDKGRPLVSTRSLTSDPSMRGLIVPLMIRESVIGLVALERRGQAWTPDDVNAVQQVASDNAGRLDAALLFDEVRNLATAEERQRLAREIHDGMAQEVASLGYLVDDLLATAQPSERPRLESLRGELTRVVSELRYSIFDLRREVGPGASLTSVLAEHARQVGQSAGIAVHLELAESPTRLRPAIESELLRIAQEAIANARKHSRAANLWVTCLVDAPDVYLRVEDDGRGLLPPREDSFGMAIMRERAERAGCELRIEGRPGGGTMVEAQPKGSVRPSRPPAERPKGGAHRADASSAR